MTYAELVEILKEHGVHFAPGLTEEELAKAEEFYNIRFPKALREFYAVGLPVSSDPPEPPPTLRWDWFPLWNDFSEESVAVIRRQMEFLRISVLGDVENGYWVKAWGECPEAMEDRLAACRAVLDQGPKLIPVHVRRYVPQLDGVDDPPVISVYGLDTIYYGADFTDYLYREFLRGLPHEAGTPSVNIPVWSDIVEGNNSGSNWH